MAESRTISTQETTTTTTDKPTAKEAITEKVHHLKEKVSGDKETTSRTNDRDDIEIKKKDSLRKSDRRDYDDDLSRKELRQMASAEKERNKEHEQEKKEHFQEEGVKGPSKVHAAKDKLVGGIKETIGTVAHAEGLKEAGREQKREGDAEALAAGKGKKHYDPALCRKGVGIQHKHMGPNPKKLTEGPCAGCKDGTCQIGHDYDAAICHSCTQGHCDASHVKAAGLGIQPKALHGDGVATSAPCCTDNTMPTGHIHQSSNTAMNISEPYNVVGHCSCGGAEPVTGIVNYSSADRSLPGNNTAYEAAACPYCTKSSSDLEWHSKRDKDMMDKMESKKFEKEKKVHETQQEKKIKKSKD